MQLLLSNTSVLVHKSCAGTVRTVLMKLSFNKNYFMEHFDFGLIRRVLRTSIYHHHHVAEGLGAFPVP
jgi:hypothetical protein